MIRFFYILFGWEVKSPLYVNFGKSWFCKSVLWTSYSIENNVTRSLLWKNFNESFPILTSPKSKEKASIAAKRSKVVMIFGVGCLFIVNLSAFSLEIEMVVKLFHDRSSHSVFEHSKLVLVVISACLLWLHLLWDNDRICTNRHCKGEIILKDWINQTIANTKEIYIVTLPVFHSKEKSCGCNSQGSECLQNSQGFDSQHEYAKLFSSAIVCRGDVDQAFISYTL